MYAPKGRSGISRKLTAAVVVLVLVAAMGYYLFFAVSPPIRGARSASILVTNEETSSSSNVASSTSRSSLTTSTAPETGSGGVVTTVVKIYYKTGYSPSKITVVIGVNNTVQWVNDDPQDTNTVTANSSLFDSGTIAPLATFTYVFTSPGIYDYYCVYHAWMRGVVIVKSES